MWQAFTRLDCLGVDGWYECSFGESVTGTARVVFRAAGPIVAFTALTCDSRIAAAYPQGCTFSP